MFEEIKASPDFMQKFLAESNHRALFCKVMDRARCIQTFGHIPIDSNVCVAGHDLNRLLVEQFFNCVAKNLVKDITSKANPTSQGPSKKKCKIAKLNMICVSFTLLTVLLAVTTQLGKLFHWSTTLRYLKTT